MESMMTDIRHLHSTARMSQAVLHGGLVYTAGQVAQDNIGAGVAAQTAEVLRRVDDLLHEAGTDKTRILSVCLYLPDLADFDEMNQVWDAWVAPEAKPARTTISAALADPGYKIEIGVIAAFASSEE
jgi:enamine deaminase RidA (YjgF/YER057c/UK114 family)